MVSSSFTSFTKVLWYSMTSYVCKHRTHWFFFKQWTIYGWTHASWKIDGFCSGPGLSRSHDSCDLDLLSLCLVFTLLSSILHSTAGQNLLKCADLLHQHYLNLMEGSTSLPHCPTTQTPNLGLGFKFLSRLVSSSLFSLMLSPSNWGSSW